MQKKIKLILILIVVITAVILLWFYYIQWQSFKQESVRKEKIKYNRAIKDGIAYCGKITNIMPPRTITLSLDKFGMQTIELTEDVEILGLHPRAPCGLAPCDTDEADFSPLTLNSLGVGQEIGIDGKLDNLSRLKVKRIISQCNLDNIFFGF